MDPEYRNLKEAQKSARGADRNRIVRQLLDEEKRRKEEAAKKAKLKALGACPAGYHWIKQTGGYRCAGDSRWMSDGDVGTLGNMLFRYAVRIDCVAHKIRFLDS